jgi:hypothetical protein
MGPPDYPASHAPLEGARRETSDRIKGAAKAKRRPREAQDHSNYPNFVCAKRAKLRPKCRERRKEGFKSGVWRNMLATLWRNQH